MKKVLVICLAAVMLYESYEGFNTESGSSCVNYDYAIWGEDTEYFITQGVI